MTTKIAILGTGWGVNIQAPIFRQAGFEIAALWARSEEKAQELAAEHSIPFGSSKSQAVISHPEVDLVSITTPPHTHAELTTAALEAGKHVLCEKPTAFNVTEAAKMLSKAQTHPEQIALLDHQLRFLPILQKMKALLQDGYVGQVYHIAGTAWDGWILDLTTPWHWWHDREAGGGILGAVGSHLVDLATWVLNQHITAVSGDLQTFVGERIDSSGEARRVTSDDYFTLRLRLEDGGSGYLEGNSVTAGPPVLHLVVAGSAGSLHYDGTQLIGYRAKTDTAETLLVDQDVGLPPGTSNTMWTRGTFHLATALRDSFERGERTKLAAGATFADGLHVQRVLDATRESHERKSWIDIKV